MEVFLTGIVVGVVGTVVMDAGNRAFARMGVVGRIEVGTIGRMAAGWARGRFRYGHPSEMRAVKHEWALGLVTHYLIGVGLAVPFLLGWSFLVGGSPSPGWILVYGVLTTGASWFFVYPSMGFGALGLGSPEGMRATLSSLANHLFFGVGMAVAIALI